MTPYDSLKCVTGEIINIEGTPFDSTSLTRLGDRIDEETNQLKVNGGSDHNWILDTNADDS